MQAPLLDHLALRDVEHADFRGHDHVVVVGDDIARGTQAIAVEGGADLTTIGERHRSRTVPGFHQRGVVFVERAPVLVHQRIAGPRFGDHQHHRVRERIPAHQQQLERVVERRRVGLAVVDERPDLVQVGAKHVARDRLLPGADPVHVAAQRVDLAVVAHEAERMRQVPGGKRVGREALVHHGERRHHGRVLQVAVILADLVREQHALVDNRARRHRRHVEFFPVMELQGLDGVARTLADDVELTLERVLIDAVRAAADEHLADDRFDLLGALRQAGIVRRHVAPAEQRLTLGCDGTLDFLLAGHARGRFLRQEHHSHAVLSDRG